MPSSQQQEERANAETYENSRFLGIFGGGSWKKPFLPTDRDEWSSEDGRRALARSAVQLPSGGRGSQWQWDGEWVVDMSGGVGKDGWEYAFDFGMLGERKGAKAMKDSVRRRRWIRSCMRRALPPAPPQRASDAADPSIAAAAAGDDGVDVCRACDDTCWAECSCACHLPDDGEGVVGTFQDGESVCLGRPGCSLHIDRATYGNEPDRDVTEKVRRLVNIETGVLEVAGGIQCAVEDFEPNVPKTLRVWHRVTEAKHFECNDLDAVLLGTPGTRLFIAVATYGGKSLRDVTAKVQGLASDGIIAVSGGIHTKVGDPEPGVRKRFRVEWPAGPHVPPGPPSLPPSLPPAPYISPLGLNKKQLQLTSGLGLG